jgi:hypothetical protein
MHGLDKPQLVQFCHLNSQLHGIWIQIQTHDESKMHHHEHFEDQKYIQEKHNAS